MTHHDVIVVGAGMAGLTAAAFLRKQGHDVLILEKNDSCGGLVSSFTRQGFTYDGGVRALIDAGILTPMLQQLDLELPMVGSPVSIGLEDGVIHVADRESLQDYRDLLCRSFPDSTADIDAIIALVRSVMADMDVLYAIENPAFHDLAREPRYLFGTLMPWAPRFLTAVRRMYRQSGPFEETLSRITANQSLADVVGQHFFKSTPSFFAMSYFSVFLDYRYPFGGTGRLARAVEGYNRDHGTEIRTGARVVSVDPRRQQVRDEAGGVHHYGRLIWAADLKTLYALTSESDVSTPWRRRRYRAFKARAERRRGGDSVFTLFVGCDLSPEYFRAISHGHFFYTPQRTGLGETHRSELARLIERLRSGGIPSLDERKRAVKSWLDRFFQLNSYEISIPVLRDASMAPPGHTGLILSVLFEYELCAAVAADGWVDEFNEHAGDCIIRTLSHSIYPELAAHIVDRFTASPLTIEHRSGSYGGAITGWTFEGGPPPVVHRVHRAMQAVRTPFKHILQAGQWTYSPSGVPIAVLTGKLAADAVGRRR